MSKHKKRSFWGEDLNDKSQIAAMDEILRITRLVESGAQITETDAASVEDTSSSDYFDTEINTGLSDALTRLHQKNGQGLMPDDGFSPLTRVDPAAKEIPVVEPIVTPYQEEETYQVREMVEVGKVHVEPQQTIAEEQVAPPVMMRSVSTVRAEDVIQDEEPEDEFEYDDSRPLEFSDFQIISIEPDDDWIYITNPYNMDLRFSFSVFNLRGYVVQKTEMYDMLKKYLPLMFALIAGPALIVKQDNPVFRKFMRSSAVRKISVDKDKFMIFTVENTENKMFIVYMMDVPSRSCIFDNLLPSLIERNEETDLFVQIAGLVLNPLVNPYGMVETMWPGDRASEEIDSNDKVEEFCNIMMTELGIEPVENNGMPEANVEQFFFKRSVIGNIQKLLHIIRTAKTSLEAQMNPDNYNEKFLEESEEEKADDKVTETVVEEQPKTPVTEPKSMLTEVVRSYHVAQPAAPSADIHEDEGDELFDNVGEDVPDSVGKTEEVNPVPSKEPEKENLRPSGKPPKAGADGKKPNRSFEIPIQR